MAGLNVAPNEGYNNQRKEWLYNEIVRYVPTLAETPELLYGDLELIYIRLLNDGTIPSIETQVLQAVANTTYATKQDLDAKALELNNAIDAAEAQAKAQADSHGFRVKDYGAKHDSTDAGPGTNNFAVFTQVMLLAAGSFGQGGTMIIDQAPDGNYYYTSEAVIILNKVKIIGWGATIRKYAGAAEYSAFRTVSGANKGYGTSGSDWIIEGLTFRGNFATGHSCGVTLHHSSKPNFRFCKWIEAINNGHAIDSVATDGLNVYGCTFQGFNPSADREYVEAIQLDYSLNGAGGTDDIASWDALPTINADIGFNRFIPLTIGATTYPAPNPTGSHSRVQQRWIENIKFHDNYVEGCVSPVTTDAFALTVKGWLHFFCTRNVKITDNVFKNVPGRTSKAIYFYPITTGTAVEDAANADAVAVPLTPVMSARDVTIRGNTFIGFSSTTSEAIIDIRGVSASNGNSIKILDNNIRESFNAPNTTVDNGSDFIYIQDLNGVELRGNNVTDTRSLVYAFRCANIFISGGTLKNLGMFPGRFSTCTDVIIRDVITDSFGYGWWFYSGTTGIDISGGVMKNGRADGLNKFYFTFNGTTEYSVHDMRLPFSTGWKGVEAYGTSTKGRMKNIFATGFVNDAGFAAINTNSVLALTIDY